MGSGSVCHAFGLATAKVRRPNVSSQCWCTYKRF